MKRTLMACALGSLLVGGPAAAVPGVDEPSTIHVNAVRNPELRKYKAILAGLDAFEKHRALAPDIPELRFRVQRRGGAGVPEQLTVRIEGERDFVLPLALDAAKRFSVPRSEAALDAQGELVLNQKRQLYRIEPDVRTPGLAHNVRRLGDLRLECKVMIAIGKEEMPLFWVVAINGLLRTRDWCGFTLEQPPAFGFSADAPIVRATLREGERSQPLKTRADHFEVALTDPKWSDEAVVELEFAEPAAVAGAVTGTAAETPRTAP